MQRELEAFQRRMAAERSEEAQIEASLNDVMFAFSAYFEEKRQARTRLKERLMSAAQDLEPDQPPPMPAQGYTDQWGRYGHG